MFATKWTATGILLLGIGVIGASFALADTNKEGQKDKDLKAARQLSARNLQKLVIAMHNYHEVNEHFPPAAIYDKNDKPLLSWRVLILPYLDQNELFGQFHLNEPWDSKHNKPLLAKMPKQYAPPLSGKTKEKYGTFCQVFAGKGTIFEGKEGKSLRDITDGTSNTIAIIEAAEAVPWTKPVDLPYDDKKPLSKLGGLFDNGISAAFADGSALWLKKDFDEPTMRFSITRNDGIPTDVRKIKAKE